MDLRRFITVRDNSIPFFSISNIDTANTQSAINRAPANVRADSFRLSARCSYVGTTTPSRSVEILSPFSDSIIRAARSVDPGFSSLESNMAWKQVKIHGVRFACYVCIGSFDTEKPR